jgi:hypothetical protein
MTRLSREGVNVRERNFYPRSHQKGRAPSQLADLDGSRRPGPSVNFGKDTKPPRLRFHPGDRFEHDGEAWEAIYTYRVKGSPGNWYFCIETREGGGDAQTIGIGLSAIGAGATTPRVVYTPFTNHNEASTYFWDIYCFGSRKIVTTKDLLNMKVVAKGGD